MVYVNEKKSIYTEDIKGTSSNQEMFVYEHESEKEQRQLQMQQELTDTLQQLQRDVFAKNQQLERIAKRIQEMDKNKNHHQHVQEKVLKQLDLLGEHTKNDSEQLAQVISMQVEKKREMDYIKKNQVSMHSKLEKLEKANEVFSEKVDDMNRQANQREEDLTLFHERLDKQEAWLEKLMRQMQDLRGIIYERADEVIKKMEKSIQLFGSKWNVVHRNEQKASKETMKK